MEVGRVKILTTLILVLHVAATASAQSTRVEAIAETQAEKAKALSPEQASNAERIIREMLLSPLLSGGDGVYPWFGSVFGGAGMAGGVGFLKRLEKAAFINLQTGISINGSMTVRGTAAAPELWRGKLQADATAQWIDAKGVSFYGLGQDSQKGAREHYDYTPREFGGNLTLKPVRHLAVTGGYTFLGFTTEREAPVFDTTHAPGFDRKLQYHVTRGTIAYDWRTAPGYSTRGGFYRATFERNLEADGEPYSFDAQEYEIVQLVPLVREQFVLAGRALMTLTQTDDGDQVPAVMAPYLGSGSTLRGFSNRRFTDRNRLLLTGEYRWRPSRYLDMALFVDGGQVAPSRNDLSLSELDVAWGIGARFHGPNFNALRIEVARGREGIRLVFAGSQPF
jgi:hypothetical protein